MMYDVAVIGGGPAAATFARRYLSKCPAASLLLLDGQRELNKKPCGGLHQRQLLRGDQQRDPQRQRFGGSDG